MRTSKLHSMIATIATVCMSATLAAAADDEVCQGSGPCQTKRIVREAGSEQFWLFGRYTFQPLGHWVRYEIKETSGSSFVRFTYLRPDGRQACALSLFLFEKGPPDLAFVWDMFVGDDAARGRMSIQTHEDGSDRRVALLKFPNGGASQAELRELEYPGGARLYELTYVDVPPTATTLDKTNPEYAACHVRRVI